MSQTLQDLQVVGAAIIDDASCLAVRRSAAMSTPDQWEFPGGKVEPGESPATALRREIQEELGLEIEVGELLGSGSAVQGDRRILLDVYLATRTAGTLELREHSQHRWLTAATLGEVDWAAADLPILSGLRARLTKPPSAAAQGSAGTAEASPGSAPS